MNHQLATYAAAAIEQQTAFDVTPTWAGVLPYLLVGIENGNDTGRKAARGELARMAEAADKWNSAVKAEAGLPTYSELVEALRYVSRDMQAGEDESAALQCTGLLAVSISKVDALLARIPA